MNLFLAIVWLLLAAILFVYERSHGPIEMRIRLGGLNLSMGWIMLLLGIYNIARWYSMRAYRNEQRALFAALRQRLLQQRGPRDEPYREPDPNFRFTDEPTPPSRPHPRDQPPSSN